MKKQLLFHHIPSVYFLSRMAIVVVSMWAVSSHAQQTTAEAAKDMQHTSAPEIHVAFEGNNLILTTSEAPNEPKSIKLDAPIQSVLLHRGTVYVALGNSGMQTFNITADPAAIPERTLQPQGSVTGFFLVGDNVWMQLESVSGLPVNEWQPVSIPSPAAKPVKKTTSTPPQVTAKKQSSEKAKPTAPAIFERQEPIQIVKVGQGEALLNVGAKDGVRVAQRFSVFRETRLNKKELGRFSGREQVAVLTVIAVNESSCLAKLPRGDRVYTSDIIAPFEADHAPRKAYPRRTDHITELAFALRPLINVDSQKGAGALVDVEATHYGAHTFINLKLGPGAFGYNEDSNVLSMSLLAQGGYDSRAFAVGLGAGLALVNGNMDRMLGRWDADSADESTKGAFALSQFVRLGARDGLNLTVQNTFFYYHDKTAADASEDDSGFVYGGTTGKLNIPLNDRMDLFFNGGGGRFGYAFGEVGIFAWIRGNGDAGSLGISAATGGAGMWVYKQIQTDWGLDSERITVGGPMVSLGFAYRFGTPHPAKP
ncbi:MAG: hypothetical protein JXX29_07275 [Deltaproteobacteria bacterium]|nr:hypothetical protein [Deltaproteobacteria bacterium]MBN2671456.1 hypothetical protein [Deltaproteobacteria bacterium]